VSRSTQICHLLANTVAACSRIPFFFQSGSEGADSFGSAEVPLLVIIGSPGTLFCWAVFVGAGLTVLGLLSSDILTFFYGGPLRMLLARRYAGSKGADKGG
jgi:hypothetical protein